MSTLSKQAALTIRSDLAEALLTVEKYLDETKVTDPAVIQAWANLKFLSMVSIRVVARANASKVNEAYQAVERIAKVAGRIVVSD